VFAHICFVDLSRAMWAQLAICLFFLSECVESTPRGIDDSTMKAKKHKQAIGDETVPSKKAKDNKISPDQISAALRDFAVKAGPSFFKYDETALTHDAKISGKRMIEGKIVLAALHKLLPSLRFKRSELKLALGILWAESTWRRPASEQGDWTETMSRRLMNACRAFHTTSAKKSKPSWFQELATFFGTPAIAVAVKAAADDGADSYDNMVINALRDSESEEESTDETPTTTQIASTPETRSPALALVMRRPEDVKVEVKIEHGDDWFYRFDTELKQVIRRKPNSKNCPEFAVTLEVDEDADDAAPVEAIFADGSRHICPDLTLGQYKSFSLPRAGSSSTEEHIWSGEHHESHNNLFVRFRADRGMLVSLFEQKKQICQIALEWFEEGAWRQDQKEMLKADGKNFKQNTTEARAKGAKFMLNLAHEYAAGRILKPELYKMRDENLKKDGLSKSHSAPKATKRSASKVAEHGGGVAEVAVETAEVGTVEEPNGPIMKKPCRAPLRSLDMIITKYRCADTIEGMDSDE
jgi:hypothetical protein